ncbi:Reverse transcriptase [Penicillium occitanis (nom. inval.)]|nr:Reverse transcriptase [Penicillium occitanis (nom. inval.)]PCG88232.1 hypothetical protein PENOC_111940 [Penicillium occitanis (nom. inval.)]
MASGLALDVSGAFDNVDHTRVVHDLRKRQVPEEIIGWIVSFLSNRRTSIVLLEGNMGEFTINTGIPQGSPLSPILFLFFNADLIEQIRAECPDVFVIGYIDDVFMMAFGSSAAANCRTLTQAHQVAERWERTHASKFAPAKYQLAHFWRKHQSVPKPRGRLDVPLTIKGIEVEAKDSIKYLGVLLDTHLTGEAHVRQMRKKAAKLVAGLSSIAGST